MVTALLPILLVPPDAVSVSAYSFHRPGGILGRALLLPHHHHRRHGPTAAVSRRPPQHSAQRFLGSSTSSSGDDGGERAEEDFLPPVHFKEPDEFSFIKSTLLTNFMFQSLPETTLDKLVLAFDRVELSPSSTIIEQGSENIDYFYVINSGDVAVTINGKPLPDPYGTLSEGTVFGELAMLYKTPRAATVTTKSDCTLYRVDRRTFRHFLDGQDPTEKEDGKTERRHIDAAIDKIAGVKTRYSGSIIRPYRPNRWWLWRRWTGTTLQHAYRISLFNMAVTAAIGLAIGRRADCTWAVAMAPDQSHPVISRLLAFSKNWHYMQGLTTFILTFFLSQSYALWREMYSAARKIQGRLNDVGFLLATSAERDGNGKYTQEASECLDDVAAFTRLFHAFCYAKYASQYSILLSPRGMSRMLSRGLLSQSEFNVLQSIDPRVGAQNVCLEWMTIRAIKGMEEGAIREDEAVKHVLLAKISDLRGTYAGISDILDGRMPLAYAHIVQILTDVFVATAPAALYAEMGVWAIFSCGILTLFYSGLLDLAKIFLDPLDNDDWFQESVNMDIGVLIREGNAGSTRWKNGAEVLPF